MGKVIKMIDLLNMLFKKEIKDKQKFRVTLGSGMTRDIYYVESEGCNICCFKHCNDDYWWTEEIDLNDKVEILDEEDEIDIQSIEKIDGDYLDGNIRSTNLWTNKEKAIIKQQNIIIEAVKQLDNKLKEK